MCFRFFAGLATHNFRMSGDRVPAGLRRLMAEFGMGSGLYRLARATRPAKNGGRTTENRGQKNGFLPSSVLCRLNEAKLALAGAKDFRQEGRPAESLSVLRLLSSVLRYPPCH